MQFGDAEKTYKELHRQLLSGELTAQAFAERVNAILIARQTGLPHPEQNFALSFNCFLQLEQTLDSGRSGSGGGPAVTTGVPHCAQNAETLVKIKPHLAQAPAGGAGWGVALASD
jgi:hypothetical protein